MKTKNILLGMVAAAAALVMAGCYEKFDDPGEQTIYDDQWFSDNGFSRISVGALKDLFTQNVGDPADTSSYDQAYYITQNYYIKGKVTSTDAFGNFYRNLYIQDSNGDGIEIKVGLPSMYSKYLPGQTIYVVCRDLALGNYRRNLSLGLPEVEGSSYANKYIEVKYLVDVHIKQGERTTFAVGDTLVLNSANIADYVGSDGIFKASLGGRLIRIEDAESTWGTFGTNQYPTFQLSAADGYANVLYTTLFAQWQEYDAKIAAGEDATAPSVSRPANFYTNPIPSWAYQEYSGTARYYGSARFTVGSVAVVIRTSGYSRFALDPIPDNGEIVDITGIVNLYTSSSGGFATNQILLNDSSDVK